MEIVGKIVNILKRKMDRFSSVRLCVTLCVHRLRVFGRLFREAKQRVNDAVDQQPAERNAAAAEQNIYNVCNRERRDHNTGIKMGHLKQLKNNSLIMSASG